MLVASENWGFWQKLTYWQTLGIDDSYGFRFSKLHLWRWFVDQHKIDYHYNDFFQLWTSFHSWRNFLNLIHCIRTTQSIFIIHYQVFNADFVRKWSLVINWPRQLKPNAIRYLKWYRTSICQFGWVTRSLSGVSKMPNNMLSVEVEDSTQIVWMILMGPCEWLLPRGIYEIIMNMRQ